MKKAFVGGKVIAKDCVMSDMVVLADDHVLDIVSKDALASLDAKIINYEGYLAPGFIDLHIHGSAGKDVMDATPDALSTIANAILPTGTTGFLATTMTMPSERIWSALDNVRSYQNKQTEGQTTGAHIIGVHLEGPFINPKYKGAQPENSIVAPNLELIKNYIDIIKLVTLAPEMDEEFAFIHEMQAKHPEIVLSIGHSGASYDCACKAHEAGVSHITHCFNAMTGLHHRNPGIVGAALAKPFSTEYITDTIHVHPDLFQPIIGAHAHDKPVLVTDAMMAAMMPEGDYELGGQPVQVRDGVCRLADGTIAGSIHRTDNALRNMIKHTNFSLDRIVSMLTYNPAKVLHLEHERGSIAPGTIADFVVLNEEFAVNRVYQQGELTWTL